MAGGDKLYTLAEDLLASVVAQFGDESIELPARQYVANGEVAHDCDQLTVAPVSGFIGNPEEEDPQVVRCASTLSFDLEVRLLRCVPVPDNAGNPPNADAIQASAQEILTDAYVMSRGLIRAVNADAFGESCHSVRIGLLEPVGPDGGFGGWRAVVTALLL